MRLYAAFLQHFLRRRIAHVRAHVTHHSVGGGRYVSSCRNHAWPRCPAWEWGPVVLVVGAGGMEWVLVSSPMRQSMTCDQRPRPNSWTPFRNPQWADQTHTAVTGGLKDSFDVFFRTELPHGHSSRSSQTYCFSALLQVMATSPIFVPNAFDPRLPWLPPRPEPIVGARCYYGMVCPAPGAVRAMPAASSVL